MKFFYHLVKNHDASIPHLPKDYGILEAYPNFNDEIESKLISGRITLRPAIKQITENGVLFEGEREELAIDVIILATGYSVDFTFSNSVQDLKDENLVDQKLEKSHHLKFTHSTKTPSRPTSKSRKL